jgi:hypothetical protein
MSFRSRNSDAGLDAASFLEFGEEDISGEGEEAALVEELSKGSL